MFETSKFFTRYGVRWPSSSDPLDIEFYCIRKGGRWKTKQGDAGEGLFQHYKNAMSILWPEDDWHRWAEDALREIVANKVTCLLGPANSNKTYSASKFGLIDYFCHPEDTCVLVSSTDVRGLELRVWGAIKGLYNRALEKYPNLPGAVLESIHAITTESLEDTDQTDKKKQGRILNKGIICFITGTMVDTPSGPRPIEKLKAGDMVINACGIGRVKATQASIAPELVRVKLSGGKTIDCTPEHPFFTRRGWTKAIDLNSCDVVFSVHETMRLLRGDFSAGSSKLQILFKQVSEPEATAAVCSVREPVHAPERQAIEDAHMEVLRYGLRGNMGIRASRVSSNGHKGMPVVRQADEGRASQPRLLLRGVPEFTEASQVSGVRQGFHFSSTEQSKCENGILRLILQMEMEQPHHREAKPDCDRAGADACEYASVSGSSSSHLHREANPVEKCPTLLRSGHCVPGTETCRGDRRRGSSDTAEDHSGQGQDSILGTVRVEGVEILKPSGDNRYSASRGGYTVHNLEVESHPSYSVEGVIVHNCIPCLQSGRYVGLGKYVGIKQKRMVFIADESQLMGPTFLDAVSNLGGARSFKFIPCGNPIDATDPLGMAAEPLNGWASLPEPQKTSIWKTRFLHGKCLNFVGTDSPNFDYPADQPPRFPYLIHRTRAARC